MALPTTIVPNVTTGHNAHHEFLHAMCYSFDRTLPLEIVPATHGPQHHAHHLTLATALGGTRISDHHAEHIRLHAILNPGPRVRSMPSGYTALSPGAGTWATTINSGATGTHYWLPAGTYTLGAVSTVTPKNDMIISGEVGTIVDGGDTKVNFISGGTGTGVEISDLKIQNFTGTAMSWEGQVRTGWNVHHNEINDNNIAMNAGSSATVHHNYTHHNDQYGWAAFEAQNTAYQWNESSNDNAISHTQGDQGATKFWATVNHQVKNNYMHDSSPWGTGNPHGRAAGSAIWWDTYTTGDGSANLAEGNLVEDCHQGGVEYELGTDAIFRYNIVRDCHGYHVFVSNASFVEVHDNVLLPNFATTGARAIMLQQNNGRGSDESTHDNNIHDNYCDISNPVTGAPMMGMLTFEGADPTEWDGSAKNNVWQGNDYKVASLTGSYWFYQAVLRTFDYWQNTISPGRDTTGSQSL